MSGYSEQYIQDKLTKVNIYLVFSEVPFCIYNLMINLKYPRVLRLSWLR